MSRRLGYPNVHLAGCALAILTWLHTPIRKALRAPQRSARGVRRPLHARSIVHQFKKHLRLAGLPDVRFHDLRHTCATLLLSARVNPKVVSELLGHASVSITLDLYSHVIPDMQQDAAETMGRMLYG